MLHVLRDEIADPDRFVVTLELVPGPESRGRAVETVMRMAADAYADGRVSAVSITDNPGGNPSLSPDVLAHEIFRLGMDVIVHFTCRDMNRLGMESRALQLDLMGIKNILALNGDYSGQGFGGQGAPVFDLDSVTLVCMLTMLTERLHSTGDPEGFLVGCAVSPFKSTEGECFAQYAKLCKKISAGAHFIITQLGYDVRKFQELLQVQRHMGIQVPTIGSLYFLTPRIAHTMHEGRVPGAVVTKALLKRVENEWTDRDRGRTASIERCARLAAVLKGLGYRGIHIGGIQRNFETAARVLDRLGQIESRWTEFVPEFDFPQQKGFYVYAADTGSVLSSDRPAKRRSVGPAGDRMLFRVLETMHKAFFDFDSPLESFFQWVSAILDKRPAGRLMIRIIEDSLKKVLLSCQSCGDCGIQHVAFLCPESQCPKHIRNGACGGSSGGKCEVYPDRPCVWFRAYNRWAAVSRHEEMARSFVPPRMWELNRTSSWLNFHLKRDHQSTASGIARFCTSVKCGTRAEPIDKS